MASEYSRMDWGAGNVRRLPFTGFQGKYPYRSRDRDNRFIGPMAPDYFTNDFYRGGLEGSGTNQLAMAGKKKRTLATVPGSRIAPNVPEHSGYSDDLFKQDPHRTYNHGYRYNNYGLQPLYFG